MTNKKDVLDNCQRKMYIKLDANEEQISLIAIEEMDKAFKDIETKFPNLTNTPPMTHTIEINDIVLREDVPLESTDIEELLKNATNINGREIEVPKVVGE